jgi:hypothetical protein
MLREQIFKARTRSFALSGISSQAKWGGILLALPKA